MPEVTNIAVMRARAGRSEKLGAALTALIAPTRMEPGCGCYDVHRSNQDQQQWMVIERWANQQACDRHVTTAHVQQFIAMIDELIDGSIDVRSYSRVDI